MQTFARISSAALVAAGLLGAGWLAGQGITRFRTDDRYVTVKGSAERTVDADLVVWPLAHSVLEPSVSQGVQVVSPVASLSNWQSHGFGSA